MTSTSRLFRLRLERFGAKQDMITPSCIDRRGRSVPSSETEEQLGNGAATLHEPHLALFDFVPLPSGQAEEQPGSEKAPNNTSQMG